MLSLKRCCLKRKRNKWKRAMVVASASPDQASGQQGVVEWGTWGVEGAWVPERRAVLCHVQHKASNLLMTSLYFMLTRSLVSASSFLSLRRLWSADSLSLSGAIAVDGAAVAPAEEAVAQ